MFRNRTTGTDSSNGVSCPNFQKIARGFNIQYRRIDDNKELALKLKSILALDGPVICEIMGLPDQGYIHVSHTKDSSNKIVLRPIEDQSPFLDRDLFLSEMIIKPIDQ